MVESSYTYRVHLILLTIEVNGSGTVSVDFLNHQIQILGSQFVIKFLKNFSECGGGNVTVTYVKIAVLLSVQLKVMFQTSAETLKL
jgi:hypothetical protein